MSIRPETFESASLNRTYGVKSVLLVGRNDAISTGEETVWQVGGGYAPLTTAVAFEIVSSNANDTAAGTGARTVYVDLVDGNFKQTTQTLTLNGTTAVAITGTYIACNRMRVTTVGSNGAQVGNINVRTVAGPVIKRQLPSGPGISSPGDTNFIYTIPAGAVGLLTSVAFGGTGITGDLKAWLRLTDSTGVWETKGHGYVGLSAAALNPAAGVINLGYGLSIPEKTCVELRCLTSVGAGDLAATAQLFVQSTDSNTLG